MKTLIEDMARMLLEHAEAVSVTEQTHPGLLELTLSVAPDDEAYLKGEGQSIWQAMVALVSSVAAHNEKKVRLKLEGQRTPPKADGEVSEQLSLY